MTLADEIAYYVAGSGRPMTSREIAGGIQHRLTDVIEVLGNDPRFTRWPSKRSKLYGVQIVQTEDSEAAEQSGTLSGSLLDGPEQDSISASCQPSPPTGTLRSIEQAPPQTARSVAGCLPSVSAASGLHSVRV